jgi:hypothetical protein
LGKFVSPVPPMIASKALSDIMKVIIQRASPGKNP